MADPPFLNECVGIFGFFFGHRFSPIYDPKDGQDIAMVCTRCGCYSGPARLNWVTRPGARIDGQADG